MKSIISFATAVGILLGASAAHAVTVIDNFSGNFGGGVGTVSGQITSDVVAGQAISGSGSGQSGENARDKGRVS